MHSYKELIRIDKKSSTPIYLQITNRIMLGIRRGYLQSGLKLPATRELSALLKIHRNTINSAYEELMAQGWVEIIPRKGTFIAQKLPEIKYGKISDLKKLKNYPDKTSFLIDEKKIIKFPISNYQKTRNLVIDDGFPDTRLAPMEALMREMRRLSKLSTFQRYYKYGESQGTPHLLETLSLFLNETRGLPISAKNLLITKGAQMGIYIAAKLLLEPGDNVITGEPGFFSANLIFKHNNAVINTVPVDDFGINIDEVEKLCRKKKIKLIYVIPHHHHPTTVTLIPERRLRLLELAARYNFAIIEDDYDYDFHYNSTPILPMASLDNFGNVIYIGTLTKTLVPAVRLGFIVAPENIITSAAHLRRAIDWQGDSIMEIAIAELYRDGTITRHIKKAVKTYHQRRDNFCQLLEKEIGNHISFKIPDGGMSVWVKFKSDDLLNIASRAFEKGLTMSNGKSHNSGKTNYNSARLGFASLNYKEQESAIDIIKSSI